MFEHQQDLEREQGYRGPATRFFGPLDDVSSASMAVREMSLTVVVIGVALGLLNRRGGWLAVLLAASLAVPAILLAVTRSRVAAVLLAAVIVIFSVWILVLHRNLTLLSLVICLALLGVGQRAFRAAFVLQSIATTRPDPIKEGGA